MKFLKKLPKAPPSKPPRVTLPSIPPREAIIEMLRDRAPGYFDEVTDIIYSSDSMMRYVILKDTDGFLTYALEQIYFFDEDEWNYICNDKDAIPGMWTQSSSGTRSLFNDINELMRELRSEPCYKAYFI